MANINNCDKSKAQLIKELENLQGQNDALQKSFDSLQEKVNTLLESSANYQSLYENAPLGYQSLDENGNLIDVNQAWCSTLGYSRDEVIGRNFAEFIHPDYKQHFYENFPKFRKVGYILGVEFEMIKKDGTEIIVSFNGKIGHNSDNSFKQTHCIFSDITRQKRLENELLESNFRLRNAGKIAKMGYMEMDLVTKSYYMSDEIYTIYGFDKNREYTPQECMKIVTHPDDFDQINELFLASLNGLDGFSLDHRSIHPEKGIIWINIQSETIKDQNGTPIKLMGTIIDITERKLVEKALRESEQLNSAIIDSSPIGISVRNPHGKLLKANKAWQNIWHISDDLIHGYMARNPVKLEFDSRDSYLGKWQADVKKVYETGGYLTIPEIQLRNHRSGQDQWVSQVFYAIYDEKNNVDRVVILTEDITKRKLSEISLRESEQLNRAIIEKSPLGITIRNSSGKLLSANNAWLKIWGVSQKEYEKYMEGIPTDFDFDKRDAYFDKWRQDFEKIFINGGYYSIPEFLVENHRSGTPCWMTQSFYAIKNQRGEVERVISISQDITEHKKFEENIKASEEKFRSLYSTMVEGLCLHELVYDEQGNPADYKILDINPAYETILGIKRIDAIGSLASKLYGAGGPPYLDRYAKVAETGMSDYFEVFFAPMEKYFAISVFSPAKGKFATVFSDITTRVNAEQTSSNLARILENSLNEIYIFDAETYKFVQANRGARENIGYSEKELYELTPVDIKPEFTLESFNQLVAPLLSGDEEKIQFETVHRRKDGTTYPIEVHVQLAQFKGKQSFISIVVDNTTRKIIETELKESRRKYQELFDLLIEGVGLVDENEIIQFCNPAYAKIFDEDSPEKMIGKNLLTYIPEDQTQRVLSESEKRKHGQNSQYVVNIITAKSKLKKIMVAVRPKYDDKGNYIGALGSVLDITEESRLRDQQSRAERLEAAGKVAGQVAHDFNNLLAPLVAYPDFIKEELPGDHPCIKYLDDMERSANQIAEINQQLLTLSRRGHYNQEIMNFNLIIEHALRDMPISPQTLVIETELDKNLMNIKGGAAQMHRIISNLIHNARDALQDIGNIRIKTENYYADNSVINYGKIPRGEYVKVTIEDNGCGIPESIRLNIFDPFFTTKKSDKKRGSGLGLSVVDAVIKDHNGYLDLKSVVGEGTAFYLYFPISREKVEPDMAEDEISGGSETVLIVDDDESQCQVAKKLLERLGYEADVVNSGEAALEYLKKKSRDILMLDMIMPGGMDGAETFKQALEINPAQKAIVVSGYSETERVEAALSMGAKVYLRKPITLRSIATALKRATKDENNPVPVTKNI